MEVLYNIYDPIWTDYEIGNLLGQGSFGNVYELRAKGKQPDLALKEVQVPPKSAGGFHEAKLQGMDYNGALYYYEGMKRRALEEVEMMKAISKYKEFVHNYDYQVRDLRNKENEYGWVIFIQMERLIPFKDRVISENLTVDELYTLSIDMCNALICLKKEGILHRDIKPENIFYDDTTRRFKLGDFGISYYASRATEEKGQPGTLTYMSPEVYCGKTFSYEDDLYALGMLLYKLLNDNRVPFLPCYPQQYTPIERNGAMNRRFNGECIPEASILHYMSIPEHPTLMVNHDTWNHAIRLEQIARRAIDADPKKRYNSAEEMLIEIENSR